MHNSLKTQLLTNVTYEYTSKLTHAFFNPNDPKTDLLVQLMSFLRPQLQDFVETTINSSIGSKFLTLPASKSHHHNIPGGLFTHSLECALIAGQVALNWLTQDEAEITIVAAFLHDIGKCKTFQDNEYHSNLGQHVTHEAITLEILAPQLNQLEQNWPAGANMLRCMLAQQTKSTKFPAFAGSLLVKTADHFSTSLDRRTQIFHGKPNYYYYAYDKTCNQKYLRLPR